MSWSVEVCGSAEAVSDAVDAATVSERNPHGMPSSVAGAIKEMIAAQAVSPEYSVYVKAFGHRSSVPTPGCNESIEVRGVRNCAWRSTP